MELLIWFLAVVLAWAAGFIMGANFEHKITETEKELELS